MSKTRTTEDFMYPPNQRKVSETIKLCYYKYTKIFLTAAVVQGIVSLDPQELTFKPLFMNK